MKLFGGALVAIVAVGALSIVGSYTGMFASVATAPGRVISKTLETDNIIHNYEWFHQQYQDVLSADSLIATNQAALTRLEESAGPRASWASETTREWNRLSSIVTGMQAKRIRMVTDYNAAASMVNRSIFRVDTPSSIQ